MDITLSWNTLQLYGQMLYGTDGANANIRAVHTWNIEILDFMKPTVAIGLKRVAFHLVFV